jgi:hypothetical protein
MRAIYLHRCFELNEIKTASKKNLIKILQL